MSASLLKLVQAGRDRTTPLPVWFITFTDLVGLLLAFFILLFSMSSFDAATWPLRAGDRPTPPGPGGTLSGGAPQVERNIAAEPAASGRAIDYLAALLDRKLAAEPSLSAAVVHQSDGDLLISLPGTSLFDGGGVALGDRAGAMLIALGGILATLPNRVEVAAHTEPATATAAGFASDWELSLRRALAVAQVLAEAGHRHDMIVRGYGASRFAQLSPQLSAERRHALAGRVDIVIRDVGGAAP